MLSCGVGRGAKRWITHPDAYPGALGLFQQEERGDFIGVDAEPNAGVLALGAVVGDAHVEINPAVAGFAVGCSEVLG